MPRRHGHWTHEMKTGHKQVSIVFIDMIGPTSGKTFYGWDWHPVKQVVNVCCGKGGFTYA